MSAPTVGEVIPYWYLWRREQEAGEDAGRKLRPCTVVAVIVKQDQKGARVAVLPITHSPPLPGQSAVGISSHVKRQLGLDEAKSWIVCDEFNDFMWPGFDLGSTQSGMMSFGRLPDRLVERVRDEFLAAMKAGKAKPVPRD